MRHPVRVAATEVVSYGRDIGKRTQVSSMLAWRTASLLLVRILFCIKPHMRDDGKAAERA